MSTDTVDLRPLAQHHEKRVRDRHARYLINTGLALGGLGVIDWAVIAVLTDPDDHAGLREAKPLGTVAMILGGFVVVAGILVRVFQHMQDQGREKSKRDMQKVLAEAEILRLRLIHQLRADLELRHDQIDDRLTRIERAAVDQANLAARMGAAEEDLCALRERVETAIVKADAEAFVDARSEAEEGRGGGVASVTHLPFNNRSPSPRKGDHS